jgi:hypothetical protein
VLRACSRGPHAVLAGGFSDPNRSAAAMLPYKWLPSHRPCVGYLCHDQ